MTANGYGWREQKIPVPATIPKNPYYYIDQLSMPDNKNDQLRNREEPA